jgi:hypothetical protein
MSEEFPFQKAHDAIVSMLHDYLAEKEHAERLEAENARLKAEVERQSHHINYLTIEANTDHARWLRCLEDLEKLRGKPRD